MIKVYKLTKRHIDEGSELPRELKEVKTFSTCVGHGVGTIDFSEKILEFSEEELARIVANSGEYVKFKIGNLSRYFEVEIFPEHAARILPEICECELKGALVNLREGYLIVKKDF